MTSVDETRLAEVTELIAGILEVEADQLTPTTHFQDDLDADSLTLAEVAAVLESDYGLAMDPTQPPVTLAEIFALLDKEGR
ncbi:phosphopantetheine-binding protein [Phytomonospora sp. NPDC050363]|uniref:acyl carrier protein n=1 Tax=Phytomonospora sp. NPDC050363 TaxID=3155642 RepID=UPI0034085D0E